MRFLRPQKCIRNILRGLKCFSIIYTNSLTGLVLWLNVFLFHDYHTFYQLVYQVFYLRGYPSFELLPIPVSVGGGINTQKKVGKKCTIHFGKITIFLSFG